MRIKEQMVDKPQFKCRRCGNCCRVPGYVRITDNEATAIAHYLNMDIYEFTARYTCVTSNRASLSLVSRPDNSCIFLNADNTCAIQSVKPEQCRSFPHGWTDAQLRRVCPNLQPSGSLAYAPRIRVTHYH